MKVFRSIILATVFVLSFFILTTKTHAMSVKPFAPFSEEGNPDEAYQFNEIFPLFVYIEATNFEIYENKERSRSYQDIEMCPGGDSGRDDECDNQGDECTGGPVEMCFRQGGGPARTIDSKNGSCKLNSGRNQKPNMTTLIEGHCEYTQNPGITTKVQGTDFSISTTLAYPKLQSEALAYTNIGTENTITWGSQHLSLSTNQKIRNQLMVLVRAKQTQDTVNSTGQWPLGWVDWGYVTSNGKSLISIYNEIPENIISATTKIIESNDAFFLSGGDSTKTFDTTAEATTIINTLAEFNKQNPQPEWVVDLGQSPIYSPSYRQGFVRPSICVWRICCPTYFCQGPILDLLQGTKRGLYYDVSVSEAYGAALDNLFTTYSTDQGIKIFQDISLRNPLTRYLSTSTTKAIPSAIKEDLDIVIKGTCTEYNSWSNWLSFGHHMDYLNEGETMGPNNTCPDYHLLSELEKETAAASSISGLNAIINLLWGDKVDQVDDVKYHLLTIPDAMGQSIEEIQNPAYNTRDSITDLEKIKEYNEKMTNIVADDSENLFGGKISGPADAKRRLAYYTCSDEMFSAQTSTSIEAYAMGTRIGCFDTTTAPVGKCDGQLFAKLLESSKYTESSQKGQDYFATNIKPNLSAELMNTYAAAEKETGVPCEILAGIHFVEADNNPDGSLVSGRAIGTSEPDAGGKVFRSLLETAKYAGEHLSGKVGNLKDVNSIITALSRYNGGGNSNCQLGYPYPIPYGGCPRVFEGEDDPYPTNYLDNKHNSMYLLYCADHTACVPQVFERPGSFTVALNVYNSMTKGGYENTDLPTPPKKPLDVIAPGRAPTNPVFFPKSCGPQSLSTALGCIPYTRDAFVSALLTFIVGIAGAIALVTMLIATVQIMTAGGNAEQLKKGRELFTSAIIGLLFLIFSASLLRIIAGDIIKLPGFGG